MASDIVGNGYRISFPELEMLVYWEGDEGFLFHGGWGVTPPVVAVPSEDAWDEVTPEWLHARRDVVLSRLRESGHVLRDDDSDWQYRLNPEGRRRQRSG